MINQIVHIDRAKADETAEGYFRSICGFKSDDPAKRAKFEAMMAGGLAVRDRIKDRIELRAIVSSFADAVVRGSSLETGPITFDCTAFELLDASQVKSVYAYILTTGSFELESTSVLEQFYADAWGTAYVDAGRDLLQQFIQEHAAAETGNATLQVSDSFGPGYYGMELEQVAKFFSLLDHGAIGVELTGNTCMLPLKSCVGFFIAMEGGAELPQEDCKSCLGQGKSCSYCRGQNKSI